MQRPKVSSKENFVFMNVISFFLDLSFACHFHKQETPIKVIIGLENF
jgi:hypothetical protein